MRREATLGLVVVTLAATGALFAGCASFEADICAYAKCDADGSTADGPTPDGTIPDAGPDSNVPNPPGCESVKEPLKNPEKCFTDEVWAFVSPNGNDANPGTKQLPYKTIGKALQGSKPLVAACEGTYAEALGIERTVGLYGGVSCDFGKAGGATTLASGKPVGLTAKSGAVTLNGVNVRATDAAAEGESSIGILAESGVDLKVIGGTVTAGAGAPGAGGTTGTNYDVALDASDPKIKGSNASGNAGGAVQTCANLCVETPGLVVEGGKGGIGDVAGGAPGAEGKTAVPGAPATAGKGGVFDGTDCANGRSGAAAPGANGGAGATSPGRIEGGKWQVSRGASGQTARPGQGGGGGSGGASATVGGGGGGGCGGCGGAKGQGGQSGGSSFGVLSLGATVTLENVTVKAGTGGKGGAGSGGQTGQMGGAAGAPASLGIGCTGGPGGQGGQGGGGGGGAGGHSVAVAYSGTKPTQKGVKAEPAATAAKGGDPGETGPGATTPSTAGKDGETAAELDLNK
ncbi:MAG: DUF1565 domain-containing protein [Myxococcales bacterium]|nr:DUF1565 domain-containing protein [Myxococcales bacterium]